MIVKHLGYTTNRIVRDGDIRIYEEDDVALGVSYTVVSRRSRARVLCKLENTYALLSCDEGRIVRGRVIHDDDLRLNTGCGFQGGETVDQISGVIVNWHNNGNTRGIACHRYL